MHSTLDPVFMLPMAAAIFIYGAIKLGGIWLPTGQVIAKATSPRTYWTLIGLSCVALVALVGLAVSVEHGH